MLLQPLINPLLTISRQAGQAIMQVYQRDDFGIREKADNSPLTEADLAAHRVIHRALKQLTPGIQQLSEEDASISFAERSQWQRYWLIDPLDGTKEFIRRNDEFTVNIALIEHNRPILGVIYLPVKNVIYYGGTELGAWKQLGSGPAQQIHCRKLNTSLTVLTSRRHKNDRDQPILNRLPQHFNTVTTENYGSSLKMCRIAEGKADFYPRLYPTCEWDTAAAQAIVEAAGGLIIDTDLKPLRYNQKDSLLNPDFFVIGDPKFPSKLLTS